MTLVYLADFEIPAKSASSIQVVRMCEALGEMHHVILIVPGRKGVTMNDLCRYYGVKESFRIIFISIPRIPGRNWLFAGIAFLHLLKIRPSLVYGRAIPAMFAAIFRFKGVIELHRPPHEYGLLYGLAFRFILSHANCMRVVVISNGLLDIVHKKYPSSKYLVAHDAAKDFSVSYSVHHMQGDENLNYRAGYAGSFYKGRGLDIVIRMATGLPDVEFHIAGGTREEALNHYKMNIPPNVIFHGHMTPSEVHGLMSSMDFLLAPYQYDVETIGGSRSVSYMSPLKIFEYMSCKKPIIASDLPALREILDETCAVLVPPNDVDQWIMALNLLKDKKTRETLSINAYNKFSNQFTWSVRAEKVIDNLNVL